MVQASYVGQIGAFNEVERRTEQLAEHYGAVTEANATAELVAVYGAEQAPSQLAQLCEFTVRHFVAERNRGKHNDAQSVAIGVAAVVRRGVQTDAQNWFPEEPIEFTDCVAANGKPDKDVVIMRMPGGVFVASNCLIVFAARGVVDADSKIVIQEGRVNIAPGNVRRIHGFSGELWVNPDSVS